jgi:hypothetical protein
LGASIEKEEKQSPKQSHRIGKAYYLHHQQENTDGS